MLSNVQLPPNARCETWVENGTEVTPYYDPMLAKIIVRADTRHAAVQNLQEALELTRFDGIETNLDYIRTVIRDPEFAAGGYPTSFLSRITYEPHAVEVIEAGMQTTVQDYPGRLGYWHVGVPPSGPMDPLAFLTANRLAGNPQSAAALECTMTGPALRFLSDAMIAITGANMRPRSTADRFRCGNRFTCRKDRRFASAVSVEGSRTYIAIHGGLDIPAYLDSCSTFILGKFGGHGGRTLQMGDVLRWKDGGRLTRLRRSPKSSTRYLATRTNGRSVYFTARTARRISSPMKTSK